MFFSVANIQEYSLEETHQCNSLLSAMQIGYDKLFILKQQSNENTVIKLKKENCLYEKKK